MAADARFVGTWRLISQHTRLPDGTMTPSRGDAPSGVIMYDVYGNMAVQLMRTDNHVTEFTDLMLLETAMRGFHAYFGTYEVDEAEGVVRHHVIGAGYPDYRGTIQVRQFSFEGDTLTLQAPTPGEESMRVLLWQRVTGPLA
jgi:hypothetical protein